MEKQSWMSGGKGVALAGGVVAVVLVILGLSFSGRLSTPEGPSVVETAQPPAPQPEQTAVATPDTTGAATEPDTAAPDTAAPDASAGTDAPVTDPVKEPAAQTGADTASEAAPSDPADADAPDAAQSPAATTATQQAPADTASTAAPEPAEQAQAAPETATATDQADTAPSSSQVAEQEADTGLPRFDTVRLAPDGEALVAGRAAPGGKVEILLDGVVAGDAIVGGDGAFVAFLSLPLSDAPRVMTLAVGQGAGRVVSDQQVIIAPVAGVASAQTADATAGEATATADADASAPQGETPQREAAPAAPALLLSDANGLRVLQPATPADPAAVGAGLAIDVISYTADGDVLLQGRGLAQARVLVYLDNAAITAAPVGQDGIWSTGLPGVAPGIYTLRLDQVNAEGRVLARIETPFKREDRDEVAAIAAAGAAASVAEASQTAGESSDTATAQADAPADNAAASGVRVVTVQPGNTLWAIARESYGEGLLFVRVFEANRDRIRDPDLIYPGQIFTIPE